jgi:hypothetical protein
MTFQHTQLHRRKQRVLCARPIAPALSRDLHVSTSFNGPPARQTDGLSWRRKRSHHHLRDDRVCFGSWMKCTASRTPRGTAFNSRSRDVCALVLFASPTGYGLHVHQRLLGLQLKTDVNARIRHSDHRNGRLGIRIPCCCPCQRAALGSASAGEAGTLICCRTISISASRRPNCLAALSEHLSNNVLHAQRGFPASSGGNPSLRRSRVNVLTDLTARGELFAGAGLAEECDWDPTYSEFVAPNSRMRVRPGSDCFAENTGESDIAFSRKTFITPFYCIKRVETIDCFLEI